MTISRRQFIQASAASLAVAPAALAAAAETAAGTEPTTVARYLLTRLRQQGVELLFGVPGATCDPLFAAAGPATLSPVINSSDLEAGYAADGYARVRGLSAVAVTYGVGTMSLLSVIGGAYAERSPIVVINGGPSPEDLRIQKELGSYFTHSIGRDKTDLALFREVTESAQRAERPEDVPKLVDAALQTAVTKQRPVYIEIAKHMWQAKCAAPVGSLDTAIAASGAEEKLAAEVAQRLRSAARPAVLLGIEVQRYGLADDVAALVTRLAVPWASDLLAKSVIAESTPGFAGVYAGERSLPAVKKLIEESDALLVLGCVMGRQYRKLVTQSNATMVFAANGQLRLGKKAPAPASLRALVTALSGQSFKADPDRLAKSKVKGLSFDERRSELPTVPPGSGLGYDEVLREVSNFIDESHFVITDTSLSMYPAAELHIRGKQGFICNGVWQAIGFSVGAAVGVGLAQQRRPVVICGDGGFQMTAQSLSTMAQRKLRSIVIVLDNGQYGIEQWLLDPRYFNSPNALPRPYLSLNRWDYAGFAKSVGFKHATVVSDVSGFKDALSQAKAADGPVMISATLRPRDLPSQLRGAG